MSKVIIVLKTDENEENEWERWTNGELAEVAHGYPLGLEEKEENSQFKTNSSVTNLENNKCKREYS